MIEIGLPEVTTSAGRVTLRYPLRAPAWIGLQRRELALEYPEAAQPAGGLGEAAALSILPFAFWAGSHLRLDPALALDNGFRQNAARLCRRWGEWFRRPFALRILGATQAAQRDRRAAGGTALFFSGGCDSLDSLLTWPEQVDALVFVRGADLHLRPERLDVEAKYANLTSRLRRFSESQGKELLVLGTNVREIFGFRFRGEIWSNVADGCALTALLAPLAGRFVHAWISSNGTGCYERAMPSGNHPDLVPWLSVPGIAATTPDIQTTRYEKLRKIAAHPAALAVLRVCSEPTAAYNCGECKKCCRTAATLLLEGVAPEATPFPRESFDLERTGRRMATLPIDFNGVILWCQLLEALDRRPTRLAGAAELAEALRQALPFYPHYLRGELPSARLYPDLPRRANLAQRLIGFPALNHGSFRKWLGLRARATFGKQRLRGWLGGRPSARPERSRLQK